MVTTTTVSTTTHEGLGYLVSGPARAAEVAVARLLDAGLIRVSREGVVSSVYQTGHGAGTPLEAYLLSGLHGGQRLDVVVKAVASSAEAEGLRGHLVARKLMERRRWRRPRLYPWLFVLAAIAAGWGFQDGMRVEAFAIAGVLLVWALVLMARDKAPLTRAGYRTMKRAKPRDRVSAVAVLGLRGKLKGRPVADLFGLSEAAVRLIPQKKSHQSNGDESSTTSCGSSGHGCGGSSGGDSGGSSCGGGGCGGGGGD